MYSAPHLRYSPLSQLVVRGCAELRHEVVKVRQQLVALNIAGAVDIPLLPQSDEHSEITRTSISFFGIACIDNRDNRGT